MGNMGKLIKGIALASVLCLGLTYSAKADAITPSVGTATSDTFTGVDIYAVTGSLNPFGVTPIICPGTGSACAQNVFGTTTPVFEVATVAFTSGGGFTVTETTPAGSGNTLSVVGTTPLITIAGYCTSASSIFTTGASALTVGTGTECTADAAGTFKVNGNSNGTGSAILTYLGNGVFSVTDNSFQVAFQLTTTPTPEASSLLMLGSGLLGLMGLAFRRKGISIV